MQSNSEPVIRRATPSDAAECARICYDAFATINAAHNFPCDLSGPEHASGIINALFNAPGFYCVVAEVDGRIVGSNCMDERAVVHGIGPITIDPHAQNRGIGRKLMGAAMERSRERGAGVRLVQSAFHNRSMALYTDLGFDVREPLVVLQGRTSVRSIPGCTVRPAASPDRKACNELSYRVHGFDRGADLAHSIDEGTALVVEREGRVTGYATALAFFGHATCESNADLQALLASAESFGGAGFLLPTRNAELFRWCLCNGLRIVEPMTLMSMGLYTEPAGAWLPSILF